MVTEGIGLPLPDVLHEHHLAGFEVSSRLLLQVGGEIDEMVLQREAPGEAGVAVQGFGDQSGLAIAEDHDPLGSQAGRSARLHRLRCNSGSSAWR